MMYAFQLCYNNHMLKRALVLIAAVIVFVVIFDAIFHNAYRPSNKTEVVLGGKTFAVDVADTPVLQERGLSGHAPLADNAGMLFVFGAPDKYGFWMKEMNFPLDIIWISSDYHIVFMEKNLAPRTYPTIYYPASPAQYVLEISAGQTDTLNIKIGDAVNFTKN